MYLLIVAICVVLFCCLSPVDFSPYCITYSDYQWLSVSIVAYFTFDFKIKAVDLS